VIVTFLSDDPLKVDDTALNPAAEYISFLLHTGFADVVGAPFW